MADVTLICPKCGKEMHAGFVPDYSDAVVLERRWFEGKFETRWLGLRLRNKKFPVPVTTYRCNTCGYLESYAR
jgi:Domain of unknown function (DUF6487)